MAKPVIFPPSMLVMNKRGGKPSRFFLRGMDFGANPQAFVNTKLCKAVFKDGVLSVKLKYADHRDSNTPPTTGEATITVTVSNGTQVSDPILVPVYVDDDDDP
jgi:hypothetical protein